MKISTTMDLGALAAQTLAVATRTWQFWEDAQRSMPPAMLQLYLLLTGQTTVARARQALVVP